MARQACRTCEALRPEGFQQGYHQGCMAGGIRLAGVRGKERDRGAEGYWEVLSASDGADFLIIQELFRARGRSIQAENKGFSREDDRVVQNVQRFIPENLMRTVLGSNEQYMMIEFCISLQTNTHTSPSSLCRQHDTSKASSTLTVMIWVLFPREPRYYITIAAE